MTPKTFALICLSLSSPLAAGVLGNVDAAPAPAGVSPAAAAAPTPVPKPLSTPAVKTDPRFTLPDFAWKWPHVSLDEARRLHARKDVVFVDGRARVEWEQSHIPGAIALPLGEFDKAYAADSKRLKKAKILVSYCHGEGCRLSDMLAQKLVDAGHHNVAVFWGGFPAWSAAGLPLQDKHGKAVINPAATPAAK